MQLDEIVSSKLLSLRLSEFFDFSDIFLSVLSVQGAWIILCRAVNIGIIPQKFLDA